MKNRKITSLLAATALLIPVVGYSQTSGSGSSSTRPAGGSSSGSQSSGTQSGTQSGSDQYGTSGSSGSMSGAGQSGTTGTTSSSSRWTSTGSMSGSGNIQRVAEDELENHVTASNLIGKTVKDRSGQEIGEVKDIGLTAALGGSGASVYGSTSGGLGGSTGASGSVGAGGASGSARVGGTTGTGAGASAGISGSAGTTGTGASGSAGLGTSGSTGASGLASAASSMLGQNEARVIIDLNEGDAFVSVPVSELRYDQTNEELTIQRSQSELQQIAQGSQTGSAGRTAE